MARQSDRWIAAARLLRRMGFGTSGSAVDELLTKDQSAYVDGVLGLDPDADPGAIATPMPALADVPPYPGVHAAKDQLDGWNRLVDSEMLALNRWWLARMVSVREPIHEKLTLLWHNHFATSATKVRFANYMGAQNQKLRTLKLGPFRDLAYAMLTDAAMIKWLDGDDSVSGAPNENLSREFMELFVLGHGNGYSEADVKAGARALTGWVIDNHGQAVFKAERHDGGEKTVLALTGRLAAGEFCDAVIAHQSSAPHVASRLWRQLAADTDPSAATLQRLTTAFANGDLKELTKAVLLDPEFAISSAVVTPVEWLIGLLRTLSLGIESDDVSHAVLDLLESLGQRPFYPPDVGGWPTGRVWISTGSVSVQAWAAGELAKRGDISTIEEAGRSDRLDAVGYLIGVGDWSDRTAQVLNLHAEDPEQLFAAAVSSPEYLTV